MSLDFDNWIYEGPQWDNVPAVLPVMFKTSENTLRNISNWIKQYRLDYKFEIVQKQIDQNHKKIQEVESDVNDKFKITEAKNSKEFADINLKLQQQEEIIKRLEKKLQMRDFQVDEQLEMEEKYMQLNKVYSKYFSYNKKKRNSIVSQPEGTDLPPKEEKRNSLAKNKIPSVKESKNNSKRGSVANSQREINNLLSNSNTNTQQAQQQSPEEIEDENFQYDNQYIIWRMINTAINECYLNHDIAKIKEVTDIQEKALKSEINFTKVKIDSNNSLISKVDLAVQEVQKMNENKFDKIFSFNLDKFSSKLERGLEDIEILQQSKILIETLDSKYDEKCNILHSEITYTNKRIDEVAPPLSSQIVELGNKIEDIKKEHETSKNSLTYKMNESSKIVNEKITTGFDGINQRIDTCQKEYNSLIDTQNNTIKTNSTSFTKNITTFRSDIIADLEKLENGLADIFPRIKEFQTMVLEIQKQLIEIAEMEHIKFNENLQQKMSVFITNIWKKADKTENALDKLIDSFLEYNSQVSFLNNVGENNFLLNNGNTQQISPTALGRANSQTMGGLDNLSNTKREQQQQQAQLRHYSMDEGEEFNDDLEENQNSQYPLINLKSLNSQQQKNGVLYTQESHNNESPNINKRPFIRQDKDQIRLKKIQYTNACKEHNISFGKALNLDTSINNGHRLSHSSQKAKRAISSIGQTSAIGSNLTTVKGSGILLQNQDKFMKNPSNEFSQQLGILYPNKKNEPFNPSKSMVNRFYDNKEQANASQHQFDNSDQLFNQSNRLISSSQNKKRAASQNRGKLGNNSIIVFNSNANQLGESHNFEIPSGQSTSMNQNNGLFNLCSPNIEPILDSQQSPIINPGNKFLNANKKKECEKNLQQNLLDIKLRILKKIKQNTDQEQHFSDKNLSQNQFSSIQK